MAVVSSTTTPGEAFTYTWTPLTTTDTTGAPVTAIGAGDRTVQFTGTFGSTTATLEGSLDGTNYATLTDPFGNAISFTATGLKAVVENCSYIRPKVTGGSAVSVTCKLLVRASSKR